MLRLHWTCYVPPQTHSALPSPRRQLFNEETGHLISQHLWLSQTPQEWGPHFSTASVMPTAVEGRGSLALRFNPSRRKEALAADHFLTLPLHNRLFWSTVVPHNLSGGFCMTKQPGCILWLSSAQSTLCCICFHVFLISFPFSPSFLLPGDCIPQRSAAQKL